MLIINKNMKKILSIFAFLAISAGAFAQDDDFLTFTSDNEMHALRFVDHVGIGLTSPMGDNLYTKHTSIIRNYEAFINVLTYKFIPAEDNAISLGVDLGWNRYMPNKDYYFDYQKEQLVIGQTDPIIKNLKKNWLDKRQAGVSNNYILKGFVESREFAKICSDFGITPGTINLTEARDKNLGITKLVSRCYSEVFGRKADTGGLNYWCGKILAAKNKKQEAINTASNGFFHSPEFIKKNTTNEQYVTILYKTFLGREPDTGGFNNWVNKLKSGTSRDTVMMGFTNSTELAKIMESYGIK